MQVQKKIKEMVIFCPLTFSIKRQVRIVAVSPSLSSLRKLAIKTRLSAGPHLFPPLFCIFPAKPSSQAASGSFPRACAYNLLSLSHTACMAWDALPLFSPLVR